MSGRHVFVLHAHLPYVLGHGEWPHGAAWLYEAAVDTYLPLLVGLEDLVASGVRPALTIEFSPVLGEQLDDDRFRHGCLAHLDALVDAAERHRHGNDPEIADLAGGVAQRYRRLREAFVERGGDLLSGFGALDRAGAIELFTCARTHGFLPLLGSERRVRRQVDEGVVWFAHRFGRAPKGIWLPECAYRPGLERVLESAGISWTIVDAHLVTGGAPVGNYPPWTPAGGVGPSPHGVVRVAASSVRALARDPLTTLQVWSGDSGYPGNPAYLEFHKKHHDGGIRYWRVADRASDLGEKPSYRPTDAADAVAEQAAHFADLVAAGLEQSAAAGVDRPVLTSPYDAELFGHWWREGVAWLMASRRALTAGGVNLATASEAVADAEASSMELPAGSWGDGGDFRVWDQAATSELWAMVREAEGWLDDAEATLNGSSDVVDQLRRTVLAIEASDWPFLVSTGTAAGYAAGRVEQHWRSARHVADMCERLVAGENLTASQAGSLAAMRDRLRLWLP